jgi:hypothetical protein
MGIEKTLKTRFIHKTTNPHVKNFTKIVKIDDFGQISSEKTSEEKMTLFLTPQKS